MRKEPKFFKVEVKRHSIARAKKPLSPAPRVTSLSAPVTADRVLEREQPAKAAPAPERRILPCLVTEAALDAAKAEALVAHAPEARPRGRPRKQRGPDEPAPLAPRKRGRPRKALAAVSAEPPAIAVRPIRIEPAPAAPLVVRSGRARARRAATEDLPRGERWKRRLPKALR